ncbi:ABC transporter permease [Acinetobacter ursingii]|uniref:ABC transporter permease n=1 Tax=Acinetobacter ursingii TaxID=108980 RepID=A0AA46NQ58_9GAMM|nr:ABC transporter permease [Acinetobacter ursingii]MCH2015638.1 ABC transporter permease [Acinetobacter ursingii]MDH2019836.1 ABC transporter permease [Acinetobacter ursingii]MDH2072197.1 ABC transporter permease [Acinetobacter ursingii]MDH2102896.1 ABC transporter permease [Acinetobacter ursingii]UYF74332.1 ABC transporter permease [Acinetobacter ursingii]
MVKPLMSHPKFRRIAAPLLLGVVLLLIWQISLQQLNVPVYLIPKPSDIGHALVSQSGLLFGSLWVTLKVTLLAFICAVVIGTLIAFLFVQSRVIEACFMPYAILFQVTPIVAIAPLVIIWIQNTTLALVVCAMLVAIFPILTNTTLGLRSVNAGLLNLFRINKASRWQELMRLRVPNALPYFFGGLRISSGLALIGAVVSEFVAGTGGTSAGLAYQILQAGFQLDLPLMFAALFLITCTGLVLFVAMSMLSQMFLNKWHESEQT